MLRLIILSVQDIANLEEEFLVDEGIAEEVVEFDQERESDYLIGDDVEEESVPESVQVSKGANAIVSYLHYYLENHGCGEKHVYFHADNCVAQNKNNIVIGYFIWRIINGLHESITLSFLPVGHTKFSCDWAFGI